MRILIMVMLLALANGECQARGFIAGIDSEPDQTQGPMMCDDSGAQEAPDGSWVGGEPEEVPDGTWVGVNEES